MTDLLEAAATIEGAPVPPAAEVVRVNLSCIGCGYNLRGMAAEGACPECGQPVTKSANRDRLIFADRAWLERLPRGIDRLLLSIVLGVAAFAAYGAVLSTVSLSSPFDDLVLWVFALPANWMTLTGAWMLTTPDPRESSDLRRWLCGIARGSVVVLGLATLFALPGALLGDAAEVFLAVSAAATCAIGGSAAVVYGYQVAQRVPHRSLEKVLRTVIGLACGGTAAALGGFFAATALAVTGWLNEYAVPSVEPAQIITAITMGLLMFLGFLSVGGAFIGAFATLVWFRFVLRDVLAQQAT